MCLREWACDSNGSTPLYIQLYFWEDLQGPRHCKEKKLMQKKLHTQMYLNFSHILNLKHLYKHRADPRPPTHPPLDLATFLSLVQPRPYDDFCLLTHAQFLQGPICIQA